MMHEWPDLDEEEIKHWVEALRQKPEALGYFNLGVLEKRSGNLLKALDAFENGLKLAPDKAEFWNEIGLIYDEQGRLSAAETYYQKALQLDPEFSSAWNNWGVTAFLREEYPLARERFEKAVSLNPDSLNAWLNLRDVCRELGDTQQEAFAQLRLDELGYTEDEKFTDD